jgi:hypothetical protein
MEKASVLQLLGAGGFGTVLGWLVFYINRNRRDEIKLGDLVTLLGIIGGSAVLALFPASSDLFGAYGIGLALGFFQYLLTMGIFVRRSKNFDSDWFLDGRRKRPREPYYIPSREELAGQPPAPMGAGAQLEPMQTRAAGSASAASAASAEIDAVDEDAEASDADASDAVTGDAGKA